MRIFSCRHEKLGYDVRLIPVRFQVIFAEILHQPHQLLIGYHLTPAITAEVESHALLEAIRVGVTLPRLEHAREAKAAHEVYITDSNTRQQVLFHNVHRSVSLSELHKALHRNIMLPLVLSPQSAVSALLLFPLRILSFHALL